MAEDTTNLNQNNQSANNSTAGAKIPPISDPQNQGAQHVSMGIVDKAGANTAQNAFPPANSNNNQANSSEFEKLISNYSANKPVAEKIEVKTENSLTDMLGLQNKLATGNPGMNTPPATEIKKAEPSIFTAVKPESIEGEPIKTQVKAETDDIVPEPTKSFAEMLGFTQKADEQIAPKPASSTPIKESDIPTQKQVPEKIMPEQKPMASAMNPEVKPAVKIEAKNEQKPAPAASKTILQETSSKPQAPETIVIHEAKAETQKKEKAETIEKRPDEKEQASIEARGLQSLIHKMQKKWNEHIMENASVHDKVTNKIDSKIKTESGSGIDGLTPQQKIKQVAKSSAERDAEIRELKDAQRIYEQGLATIKDLIAPSSMVIEYDHLQVSGMYSQSFFVYTYPRYLEVNWLSSIINSDITMDISMFIYPIDSAGILKQLRNKSAQVSSSISINQEKGNVRDPQLETALEDIEDLRDRLMRVEDKFFQFGLYFTVYSENRTDLIKLSKQIETALGGQLIFTKRADMRMEQGFNSCLPQGTDAIGAIQNMNTGPLSTSFPFVSNELSDDHGILYGLNRHNDTLIIFDRFSLENANSVVLATSGAGKSYAIKLEILRSLMLGTDIIVIDPENEYQALCEAVGGAYLRVAMNSDQRINPFDLPKPFAGDDEESGRALRQNVIALTGLLHLMLGNVTSDEEAILDQALLDTYALKGIMLEDPKPGEKEPPTMSDLHDVLMSMKGGEPLAQRLSKYTTGSFGGIFNQQTNIDMGKGMIVFCIRDIDDELRPMAMYVILNYIWNLVRSELRKRIMVVDEAWTMMQYADSAKFLAGLTRRARKYYLGITTITQNVNDFVTSSEGRTVITNSAMQILLKQSPAAIDQIAEVFHLTDGEKYTLLNSDKGQGIFFAGLQHVAIQIIASYGEHTLITTNPEEIVKKKKEAELEAKLATNE
ncbi:MAG: DUF87 domain-containing protein [Patescibacteria group bacterium]|nr:DUF87 domain-containing protein [Patescibacteria group bacterium]